VDKDKIKITAVPETVEESIPGKVLDTEIKVEMPEPGEAEAVTKDIIRPVQNEAERTEIKVEVVEETKEVQETPQAIPTINTRLSTSSDQRSKFESILLNEEKVERISSEEEQFDDNQDMEMEIDENDQKISPDNLFKPSIIEAVLNEAEDISDEEIICEDEDEGKQ
jgi:hypothetical protein